MNKLLPSKAPGLSKDVHVVAVGSKLYFTDFLMVPNHCDTLVQEAV